MPKWSNKCVYFMAFENCLTKSKGLFEMNSMWIQMGIVKF